MCIRYVYTCIHSQYTYLQMGQIQTQSKPKSKIKLIAFVGSLLVGVAGLGVWAYKKKGFGDKIVIVQTVSTKILSTKNYLFVNIPSVIQLIVVPTIKNPTNTQATLVQPYVQIRLSESDIDPFASSVVSNKNITIDSLSEKSFDPIVITINTNDLLSKIPALFKSAIQNRSIGMYTRTMTYLVTSVAKLPVVQNDKTELKF